MRKLNFLQSHIFKTQIVIGCIPGPIMAQGHLGNSDHSRPISSQVHSYRFYKSLALYPLILLYHKNKHLQTVFSDQWQNICADHIRPKEKIDGFYIQTIDEHIVQTVYV